jgi:transcriptional regulator with XRE-family HTH domain
VASSPTILGKRIDDVQSDVGTALLQIKNQRGLRLIEMAGLMGKSEDAVAKYITGEYEMGFIAWERAKHAWPELVAIIEETAADRAAKARQRALDLELPTRREKAA